MPFNNLLFLYNLKNQLPLDIFHLQYLYNYIQNASSLSTLHEHKDFAHLGDWGDRATFQANHPLCFELNAKFFLCLFYPNFNLIRGQSNRRITSKCYPMH